MLAECLHRRLDVWLEDALCKMGTGNRGDVRGRAPNPGFEADHLDCGWNSMRSGRIIAERMLKMPKALFDTNRPFREVPKNAPLM